LGESALSMRLNVSASWAARRLIPVLALFWAFIGVLPAHAAAPDLSVSSFTLLPAALTVNGNVTLSATVSNLGDIASNASTLHYFGATDATGRNNYQVCDVTINPLAVAETASPPCSMSAPVTSGSYYFFACVDPDSSETNTANNCTGTSTLTVTAANPGCQTNILTGNQTLNGSLAASDCLEALSDGSTYYFDPYEFSGIAGQQITLLLSAAQFDPFMDAITPAGDALEDDNGGGGTSAKLTLTLAQSGTYSFRITSAFPWQTGAYALSFAVAGGSAVVTPVVEYYHSGLDNYFITANASEAAGLDNNQSLGWRRTGQSFASGGSTAVCRFYGSLSPGPNSHFYTVDPAECARLKDVQANTPDSAKRWNFESLDFTSSLPVSGACASGLVPVYRAYNNGFTRGVDSNHRISASQSAIQEVVARGWSNEGVVMCAPL
jgi:CARDB